jgi:general secretion pathway protein B
MSYILDALRKADAERERDPARGIHAQPASLPADASPRFPAWIGGAVAAAVVMAAGAAWLTRSAPAPAPAVVAAVPAPVAAPAPVAVPAPPVMREAPPQVVQVAATVRPPAPPPLPVPERVAVKPVAAEPAKAAAATTAAAKPVAPASGLVLKAAPAVARAAMPTAAPGPAAARAAERILTVAELPADVQQSLPKLQISGGVYSDNASQRMLIVGGQVMNEGAELAPGAVLEQIKPHAAVLKFRGYRYSVAY